MSIHFLIPQHSYESDRVSNELRDLKRDKIEILTWRSIKFPIQKFPKVLWVRFSPRVPIIYQLSSIEEFEEHGTRVINSKTAIETCDKMSSYLFWKRYLHNDFQMPQTMITRNIGQAMKFIQERECVFKPIDLGLGQGIQRVENNPKLKGTLQGLLDVYGLLFLQEFIPNFGYDIRAIVIDNENIIEYARQNPHDFRHNVHLGGKIKVLDGMEGFTPALLANIRKIALLISEKTNLDMVGVDFIISNSMDLYVLEWNAFFNFEGVEKALNVNIAKKIALFLNKIT